MASPHIAFSTLSCPDWSWQEVLAHGVQYGYDGVEVRLLQRQTDLLAVPELQPDQLPQRRRELQDAGFVVCGLASSVRFDYPQRAERERQHRTGCRYVDLAAELEAGFVRVFGDLLPPDADEAERAAAIGRIAEGLDRLGEYAAEFGIEVLIETHGDFCESGPLREVMDRVRQHAVGVLWDTHHPWRFFGETIDETVEQIGRWVRHTHWKDSVSHAAASENEASRAAAEQARQLMSGHRHADYTLFGEGEFPAVECMRALHRIGYRGWYCLEWEKMWHPEIADPQEALPPFPRKLRELWESAQADGGGS